MFCPCIKMITNQANFTFSKDFSFISLSQLLSKVSHFGQISMSIDTRKESSGRAFCKSFLLVCGRPNRRTNAMLPTVEQAECRQKGSHMKKKQSLLLMADEQVSLLCKIQQTLTLILIWLMSLGSRSHAGGWGSQNRPQWSIIYGPHKILLTLFIFSDIVR